MRMMIHSLVAGGLAALVAMAAPDAGRADWRDSFNVLRVGVLTGTEADYRAATLEPFRVYLQDRIGIPVEIVPAATYDALIDAQVAKRVDYAIYSATSFAAAATTCECVEAIAAPLAADGALGFHSILLADADGPIRSLADARDRSIALTGDNSIAGRLVPMQAFSAEDIAPRQYFSRIVAASDPEAAIEALLAGEVDIAVGWSSLTGSAATGYSFGVLSRMVSEGRLSMARVRIIWQSRLIPFGPHAVRADMPAELKALLRNALTAMAREAPEALDAVDRLGFGGGGFVTPDPSLYAVAMDLVAPAETEPR